MDRFLLAKGHVFQVTGEDELNQTGERDEMSDRHIVPVGVPESADTDGNADIHKKGCEQDGWEENRSAIFAVTVYLAKKLFREFLMKKDDLEVTFLRQTLSGPSRKRLPDVQVRIRREHPD